MPDVAGVEPSRWGLGEAWAAAGLEAHIGGPLQDTVKR